MRFFLVWLLLLVSCAAASKSKALPSIDGKMMERIQRLTLQLSLQEYPCSQTVFLNEIKDYPFLDLGGFGGTGTRHREKLAITDIKNKVGHYGIYIYLDETGPDSRIPPVEKSEVFFQPTYSGSFGILEALILKPGFQPGTVDYMRDLMRRLNLSPSAFVRQLDDIGLPSPDLEAKLDAATTKPAEK